MLNPRLVASKVRKGQVLNLSELSLATSYPRGVLAKMDLPLEAKKMSLQDFRRVMRRRQDAHERAGAKLRVLPGPIVSEQPAQSPPVGGSLQREAAGKFYAPLLKSEGKGASHPAPQSLLRSSA